MPRGLGSGYKKRKSFGLELVLVLEEERDEEEEEGEVVWRGHGLVWFGLGRWVWAVSGSGLDFGCAAWNYRAWLLRQS